MNISPATQWFIQKFVKSNIKENIKSPEPRHAGTLWKKHRATFIRGLTVYVISYNLSLTAEKGLPYRTISKFPFPVSGLPNTYAIHHYIRAPDRWGGAANASLVSS